MDKFLSQERTAFFEKSGLPFWDADYVIDGTKGHYPYMLYTCHKESEQTIKELLSASVTVAEIFDGVAKRIYDWDSKELEKWGFPKHHAEFLKMPQDEIFCMRIGWGMKDGHFTLFEINAQTPTVWIEPEAATELLTKQFGLRNPVPNSNKHLREALNQAIAKKLKELPLKRRKNAKVGFVCCEDMEELTTMKWLSEFCDYPCEVFHKRNLDFTIDNNEPFNKQTGTFFDALIYWFPLEWVEDDTFENGDKLWDVFFDGLERKTFVLPHAIPAYFIQSKAILAYITEHANDLFTGKYVSAEKYFARTYLSPEKLGSSYIAKPIWGRQGEGCFILKDGEVTQSRVQKEYYVNQKKVYQELLTLPTIPVEGEPLNWIYESWVYKVGDRFVPGAIGLRGCDQYITDDLCYYMPIGM